jgi:hypothetical protein
MSFAEFKKAVLEDVVAAGVAANTTAGVTNTELPIGAKRKKANKTEIEKRVNDDETPIAVK